MKERRIGQASKSVATVRAAQKRRLEDSGRSSGGNPVQLLDSTGSPAAGMEDASAVLCRSRISKNLSDERKKRRRQAMPALVPTDKVQQALQAGKSDDQGVKALPLFLEDPRRRNQAGSVHASRLSEWLKSEDGNNWSREKWQRYQDAAE